MMQERIPALLNVSQIVGKRIEVEFVASGWNGVPDRRTNEYMPCFPGLTPVMSEVHADIEFVGRTDSNVEEAPAFTKAFSVGIAPSWNRRSSSDQSAPSRPIITTGGDAILLMAVEPILACTPI